MTDLFDIDRDGWVDEHIQFEEGADMYHTYDEAGLLHGSYATLEAARESVVAYGKQLEKRANGGIFG